MITRSRTPVGALVAWLLLLLAFTGSAQATTRNVTSTADSGPGSLRQVIAESSAGDVVNLPANAHHYAVNSEIQIAVPLTIQGAGASSSVIAGSGASRVFEITSGVPSSATVTFQGVTITGGNATTAPGGGAILVDSGSLKVIDSAITGNRATVNMGTARSGGGGGIYNDGGDTTVTDSNLSGNTADVTASTGGSPATCCHGGGGLYENAGTITVTGSELNGDAATIHGGDTGASNDPCCNGGGAVYQNEADGSVSVTSSSLDSDNATVDSGNCCHGGGAMYLDVDESSPPPLVISSSNFLHDTTTVTTNVQGDGCCSGGGAIATFGGMQSNFSRFDANSATLSGQECCNGGGAVNFDAENPPITFDKSDLSNNSLSISGPGTSSTDTCCNGGGALQLLNSDSPLSITNSTLGSNTAAVSGTTISGGGAVYEDESQPTNTYSNSTIAKNSTNAGGTDQGGGGLYVYNEPGATDTLSNVTLAGNTATAGSGGGVLNIAGNVNSENSIVADNTAGTDGNCAPLTYESTSGTFSSGGHNIENIDTCNFHAAGDHVDTNPLLGPLQNNGGAFSTMALLDHSPAINAGNNAACPAFDERGVARPQPPGGVCDIGAYEATAPLAITRPASNITAGSANLNATVNPLSLSTSYRFQYGTTTAYGKSTATAIAGADYDNRPVSAPIKGLARNSTYHFRVVATNELGTTYGADQKFTTAVGLKLFGHLAFVSPSGIAGVFAGCFGPSCTGRMSIVAGGKTIATRFVFHVLGNNGGIAHLLLTGYGRKLLARANKHRITASVTATDIFGHVSRTTVTLVRFSNRPTAGVARVGAGAFGDTGFVSPGGVALVFVGCFSPRPCTGTISLSNGRSRVNFRLSADNGTVAQIRLTNAARNALARLGEISALLTLRDNTTKTKHSKRIGLVSYQ